MSAGPGFAAALRNFSTLFLLTFVVFAPLHLATAWHWQKAIVVAPALEAAEVTGETPEGTVDSGHVRAYRRARVALCLAEILLLPFFIAASARVLERDDADDIPTVPDALSHLADAPIRFLSRQAAPALAVGAAVTTIMLIGLNVIADLLLNVVVGADRAWPVAGIVEAATRAAAAPFFLGPAADAARSRAAAS